MNGKVFFLSALIFGVGSITFFLGIVFQNYGIFSGGILFTIIGFIGIILGIGLGKQPQKKSDETLEIPHALHESGKIISLKKSQREELHAPKLKSRKPRQEVQTTVANSSFISRVEKLSKFEIVVHVAEVEKLVRLQVESNHKIGSLIESVKDGLNLPKGSYVLTIGEKTLSQSQTLKTIGVKEGDKLELLRED